MLIPGGGLLVGHPDWPEARSAWAVLPYNPDTDPTGILGITPWSRCPDEMRAVLAGVAERTIRGPVPGDDTVALPVRRPRRRPVG